MGGKARREVWINVDGGPGMESIVCASSEPWSWVGVDFGWTPGVGVGVGSLPSVVKDTGTGPEGGLRALGSSIQAILRTSVDGSDS